MLQAHSDVLLLFHVVFATCGRRALLPPLRDDWLHRRLRLEAGRRGARVLGVGNAADHVHLVLELHAAASLATVVGQLKGVSSHAWNVYFSATPLRWQKGYWARTVETASLSALLPYVRDQRERHASGDVDQQLEQTVDTKLGDENTILE